MPQQYTLNAAQHSDGSYSRLKYAFTNGQSIKADRIRLVRANIPYTFVNFPTLSTLTYTFPNASGIFQPNTWLTSYLSSAQWANYSVADINKSLQEKLIERKQYLIDTTTGDPYFFISIGIIKQRAYVVVQTRAIPTSLPSGYTMPVSSGWTFPGTAATPSIQFDAQLQSRLGFSYDIASTAVTKDSEGDIKPQIDPIGLHAIRCNFAKSLQATSLGTLAEFPLDGVSFDGTKYFEPASAAWVPSGITCGEIIIQVERATVNGVLVPQTSDQLSITIEIE